MMSRDELSKEIQLVKTAYVNARGRKVKHDLGRHLRRMQNELRYYDMQMRKYHGENRKTAQGA